MQTIIICIKCNCLKFKFDVLTQNSQKVKLKFDDEVAETLLITLYMKHLENQRENTSFHDPNASQLVNAIDYDFDKFRSSKATYAGVIARSLYFDQVITEFVDINQNPVVINLGCGLDSRAERISLASDAKVTFYSVDLPEVIEIREQLLKPNFNEHYINGSALETDWLEGIIKGHPDSAFIISIEGVMMYLTEQQIEKAMKGFVSKLRDAELLFDVVNVWMGNHSNVQDSVKKVKARFRSGFDDDHHFETYSKRLKLLSAKRYKELDRWNNGLNYFVRFILNNIKRFSESSRILHYQIT